MAHEVFISYASRDREVAVAVCAALEDRQIRCWIAPRDILPGKEYAEAIMDGIEHCRVFIVIFSSDANDSPQVKREVERAVSLCRSILPFRVENTVPSKALEYCLSNTQWLDALPPPVEKHLSILVESVASLMGGANTAAALRRSTVAGSQRADSGFEFISEAKWFGRPLVHIVFNRSKRSDLPRTARGIVAIGDSARGVVAIGSFPVGLLALGKFPVGIVTIGFLSIGVFSIGAVAMGLLASYGAFAFAPAALGWMAAGYYAVGLHPAGVYEWMPTNSPMPMPWIVDRLHAIGRPGLIIGLSIVSYLCPAIAKAWAQTIESARNESRS